MKWLLSLSRLPPPPRPQPGGNHASKKLTMMCHHHKDPSHSSLSRTRGRAVSSPPHGCPSTCCWLRPAACWAACASAARRMLNRSRLREYRGAAAGRLRTPADQILTFGAPILNGSAGNRAPALSSGPNTRCPREKAENKTTQITTVSRVIAVHGLRSPVICHAMESVVQNCLYIYLYLSIYIYIKMDR